MLNISGAFKKELINENRQYINRAIITLSDNTVLTVENDKIMGDGIEFDDAVGEDGTFTALGSTIINSATLTLYNNDDLYSNYDFKNADVIIYTGLVVPDGSTTRNELIRKGTFRVDSSKYSNATITLTMLDYMEQFDRSYSISTLVYPASLETIVRDCCDKCGVTLSTYTFPHSTFIIDERPNDEALTFREVLGWVTTIAGCFARCDVNGRLELKWFDINALENAQADYDGGIFDSANPYATGITLMGGTFNPWNTGSQVDSDSFSIDGGIQYITSLKSQIIAVDDVVITGVKIIIENKDDEEETESEEESTIDDSETLEFMIGSDGYIIQIENNEFITKSNVNTILEWLGTQLIGLTFRPCNITHLDNPAIEAGDVGFLWDTHGKQHSILITRCTFSPGRPQTIVCGAEDPSVNSATRYSESTKAFVANRKQLKEERSSYEQKLEDFSRRIERESSGLYETAVVQADGSTKYYYHNKPLLNESDIRILISDVGITVTPNGTSNNPTWYGLTVDGDLLARILSVHGISFDWAQGGTIKLGGRNNGNGVLQVFDENSNLIATINNEGVNVNKGTIVGPAIYSGVFNSLNASKLRIRLADSSVTFIQDVDETPIAEIRIGHLIDRSQRVKNYGSTIAFGKEYLLFTVPDATPCGYCVLMYDDNGDLRPMQRLYKRSTTTDGYINDYVYGNIVLPVEGKTGIYWQEYGFIESDTDPVNTHTAGICFHYTTNSNSYDGMNFDLGPSGSTHLFVNNMRVSTTSSSSKRFKHSIKNLENESLNPHKLLDLRVVQFIYNNEHSLQYSDMKGQLLPGFIAEEVDEIYPSATIHDGEGNIESWDERRIIPGMLALIQEQHKKIQDLESRLEKLEKFISCYIDDGR